MELTQTITLLENRKTALQSELEAINLALSILKSEYEPELKVIENANKEIETLRSQAIELTKVVTEKTTEISALKTTKEEVITE